MANNLTVTGNLAITGSSVFTGTVDLAGGALNTDLVTNFNADLLDSAHKSIDGTLAGNSDVLIPTEKAVKTYADARKAECVALTGDQTVNGIKTLGSIPVLPASNPTTDNQAARKAYVDGLDDANVKLTGDQTVAGVKTFSDLLKPTKGIAVSGGIFASAPVSENTIYDQLSPSLPEIGNMVLLSGGAPGFIASCALRTDADTIRLYGIVPTTCANFTKDCDDGDATEAFATMTLVW